MISSFYILTFFIVSYIFQRYGWPTFDVGHPLDSILPKNEPQLHKAYDLHFRIPQFFIKQARDGPPYYKYIRRSLWIRDKIKQTMELSTACSCTGQCHSGKMNTKKIEFMFFLPTYSITLFSFCWPFPLFFSLGRGAGNHKVCENAMTFVECSGDIDKKGKSGESNCCIGTKCKNRRIAQHEWCGKIKVFDTKSHGWGVSKIIIIFLLVFFLIDSRFLK